VSDVDHDGIDVNAIYNVDAYNLYTILFVNYPISFANYVAENDKIIQHFQYNHVQCELLFFNEYISNTSMIT
jgi:hypothetical protein